MCTENKKRNYFTKQFKRKVLLEYSKGKKPADIFNEFNVQIGSDKKYAVKLLHKWKKEFYKNTNMLALNFSNLDLEYAPKEIDSIGKDSENDNFLDEMLKKNKKN